MSREMMIFTESFWPIVKAGFFVTIPLALSSFVIGIVIAAVTAIFRLSNNKFLSKLAAGYVWVIRGTPLLVQLFIVYFGLPSIGIVLNEWIAGIIAFSINFGAYASESIRGAILSVPKGQIEAAKSLGMSSRQITTRIVLPQATRVATPALMGNFIGLFKQTSLASTVTILDMMMTAQRYVSVYYSTMQIYIEVALVYLFFTTIFTIIQGKTERYFSRYV